MTTFTDNKLGVSLFTEQAKTSFREIIKRMGWKLEEEAENEFIVTYPVKDEDLMDFLIVNML